MNKEQDYASDTDESDEDFRPDNSAGESSASENESEDSEIGEALNGDTEELKKGNVKKKYSTNYINKRKKNSKQNNSKDEDIPSRRASRHRSDAEGNGKGKTVEKDELASDEEDKSRTNALWADFLKDVKPSKPSIKPNSTDVENNSSSNTNGSDAGDIRIEESRPKTNSCSRARECKVAIEVVDFAGENVIVQRQLDDVTSIKENKAAALPLAKNPPFSRILPGMGVKRTNSSSVIGAAQGIGSIINQLGKKKKMSVLEKSQMDWKSFKQSEGIEEQLQTFNKGKDGYLERQDFLQRTDLRQFEIEKNLRQTARRPY